MDSTDSGWWRRHGWTVAVLLAAFSISFLLRTLFVVPLFQQWGPSYLFAGGSDSFYHWRVTQYIIDNHRNLISDPLLRYPIQAINPREPLFDWMNAVLGILFAPFFGGSANAGKFFLELQGPLWAALGVFPIYLIGKEVSGRRTGLVAALLFPLLVANIDSSTFGYANYLSFYTFFILVTVYAYLRTVRAAGTRRWVEDYRKPREFPKSLRAFVRTERTAVKWAVFTGVCFGTVALAWQGYSFLVAALVIFLIFAVIVERIRKVDSFGLYVTTWIVGLVGFPMAMPYYYVQQEFAGWFDQPLFIFFGALLILLPFLLLRDQPWVVSLPVLLAVGGAVIGGLDVLNHAVFINIVTGQGYFVKTLVYSTVAEAQAPSIDALILGYGVVTFFLAFVGLALLVYRMVRERFKRVQMMFVVFAVISIYLPISAAKFFFIGSATFALLPAEAIVRALDVGGYPSLRRNVASLSDRRSQFAAFRKAFKVRHVLVLLLLIVILLPNVWYSVDAGIPYNSKSQYNQQIYNTLPSAVRTSPGNSTSYYLGAAGTQLDTPNQYDEAGYDWLNQQDQGLAPPQRPAFISWWDYGFQAVSEGGHPTVADNFQNGIVPAGNFLLSQNESLAIGILTTTLLTAEQRDSGQTYLPASLNALLARDGLNVATLHNLLANQSNDIQLVLTHPDRYLPVDASHLDGSNALYDTVSYFLATSLPVSGVAQVYNDVQAYTGWSIRYAMVDSRLFPFSGSNTGIFYAPADLTDRIINAGGAPSTYYTVSVTGSDGNTYQPGRVPAGVVAVSYQIQRLQPFYNSMIYRIFIGYSGSEIGSQQGVPSLDQATGSDPLEPGWMLQHFQIVYKTAYYCPQSGQTMGRNPNCFNAMNVPDANRLAKAHNGSADTSASAYFGGGETMLEYFPGQTMTGTVNLPDGTAVANARVTVYDSWGIPHMTTLTSADGAYTVVLPPGNDTVNVTTGPVDGLRQAGTTHLAMLNLVVPQAVGLSLDSPTLVRPITLAPATVEGVVYWNAANNSTYVPKVDPVVPGATAILWGSGGPTRTATTDASGTFEFTNVPPGVYNFSVRVGSSNFSETQVFADPGKTSNQSVGLASGTVTGFVHLPGGRPAPGAQVAVRGALGLSGTAVANTTGSFTVRNLGPGNYTVTASFTSLSLGSIAQAFSVSKAGAKTTVNLTLVPTVTVTAAVVDNGVPLPNFPVRFTQVTPIAAAPPPAPNATGPPTNPASSSAATANSSVFLTGPDGLVEATLPAANYSVYAVGLVGTSYVAGFASAYLDHPGEVAALPPIFVGPAQTLSGHVVSPGTGLSSPTQVVAYNARGNDVWGFTNSSGTYTLWLPAANYTVQAVQGAPGSRTSLATALSTVDVSGPTRLDLTLIPGVLVGGRVGYAPLRPGQSFFPASFSPVQVSLQPGGATVTTIANAQGNFSVVMPGALPPGASFCLTAAPFGFAPYHQCGYTANALQALSVVPVTPANGSVNLTVLGLPPGTRLIVNVTAESSTAQSLVLAGGPTFVTSMAPGTYAFTAWAVAPTPPGLLLPARSLNATIPIGAVVTNLTLTIVHQVRSSGTLTLPTGVIAAAATVTLSGSAMNVTVNGAAYTSGFFVAPGSYRVYATATTTHGTVAAFQNVTVAGTGKITPTVPLSATGGSVSGRVDQPDGAVLNATFPVTLTSSARTPVTVTAIGGVFSVTLPANATYTPVVNTTQLVPTAHGLAYQTFLTAPGATCNVTNASASCTVPTVATLLPETVSGTVSYRSFPWIAPPPAYVRFVGPAPDTGGTVVAATDGSFTASLLPGNYTVYTTAGAYLANVTGVSVTPTLDTPLDIALGPVWTDSVTVQPPTGSGISSTTITFTGPGALVLTFPNVSVGVPLNFSLPVGTYSVRATSTATPYGVSTDAVASASLNLLFGNAATLLRLTYAYEPTATIAVVAPSAATVPNGGSATFTFTIRNTGDVPLPNLTFRGSPGTWNFTFSPKNVSLGVLGGSASASAQVVIRVPAGTPVQHPPITIQAVSSNGTVVGEAQPAPTIDLVPFYAVKIGSAASLPPNIAPAQATLPFYLDNPSNSVETIVLTVSDAARLTSLGWSAQVAQGEHPIPGPRSLPAGNNLTFQVILSATTSHPLPPGSATVLAVVANSSGAVTSSVTLTAPVLAVSVNPSTLIVTGPAVGAPPPLPTWLVPLLSFVPAMAVVVLAGVLYWLRTRHWRRT